MPEDLSPSQDPSLAAPIGFLMGGSVAGGGAQSVGGHLASEMIDSPGDVGKITPENMAKLRKAMGGEKIKHIVGESMVGPHYLDPESYKLMKYIQRRYRIPKEYMGMAMPVDIPRGGSNIGRHGYISTKANVPLDIFAHEMGHATGLRKSKLYSTAASLGRFASGLSTPAAIAAGYYTANPDDSLLGAAARGTAYGAGAGLASYSPTLAEEARASYRAIKGMRAIGIPWSKITNSIKRLGGAFGTYAMAATIPAGLLGGTASLSSRYSQLTAEREKKRLAQRAAGLPN